MLRMRIWARAGVVLLGLLGSGSALAYTNPYTGIQYDTWAQAGMFTALSQMQRDNEFYLRSMNLVGSQRRDAARGSNPETDPAQPAERPKRPIEATDFEPAGPRRVPEEFAAMMGDAGDAEMMRTLHGAIDGMDGFRRNNLAYAMAFVLYASIQVAEDRTLDESQQYGLIDLVNDTIINSGAFEAMSARAKTDAYDFFVLVGALITSLDEEGKKQGDRSMRDGARLLARSTLEAFGLRR